MELKDKNLWDEHVRINKKDPYGTGVITYCEVWANLMEQEIDSGKKLEDIAERTSRSADQEGITGFMYGCAVSILSKVWKHGEQLRLWHNIDIQIKNEGEKANESGSVLNPALLTMKTK